MVRTLEATTELVVTSCWCGVALAIPGGLFKEAKRRGQAIYCPLGHTFVYGKTVEDEAKELRAQVENQKKIISDWASDYGQLHEKKERVQKQLASTRGVLTRTRNRIKNGVCPCCNRSFTDLHRHMANKHPDFATEDAG